MKDPSAKACLMGGDGREVPFLIVEMDEEIEDEAEAEKERIWPWLNRSTAICLA